MKNKNKKQYIAPALKCVEFKVERGFLGSNPTQGLGNWGEKPDGLYLDNFETFGEGGNPFRSDGPHSGHFSGDCGEWD